MSIAATFRAAIVEPVRFNSRSRLVVVGTSGAGKTTLAKRLAKAYGLRDIELDALFWGPQWTPVSMEEFRARIERATAGETGWVIHGNYSKVNDLTIDQATDLIWLDYSRTVVFSRVLKRSLVRLLTRQPLWAGNRESFRKTFFSRESILRWSWTTYPLRKLRYQALIEDPHYSKLRIHHLQRTSQVAKFFDPHPADE